MGGSSYLQTSHPQYACVHWWEHEQMTTVLSSHFWGVRSPQLWLLNGSTVPLAGSAPWSLQLTMLSLISTRCFRGRYKRTPQLAEVRYLSYGIVS